MRDGQATNIALVGVAGVGKTTLGALAAGELGMAFVDVDEAFEEAEGADIDTLIERYGEEGYDRRLLGFLGEGLAGAERTIVAVPARLMSSRGLWDSLAGRAVSVHLRGEPMEVYKRQPLYLRGRKLTDEERLEARWVHEFLDYYDWRVRHCERAEHTVRVEGDVGRDAERLCERLREITQVARAVTSVELPSDKDGPKRGVGEDTLEGME
jgi:shikimate kinase